MKYTVLTSRMQPEFGGNGGVLAVIDCTASRLLSNICLHERQLAGQLRLFSMA